MIQCIKHKKRYNIRHRKNSMSNKIKLPCKHKVDIEEFKIAGKCPKCHKIIFFNCHFCQKKCMSLICEDCEREAFIANGEIFALHQIKILEAEEHSHHHRKERKKNVS